MRLVLPVIAVLSLAGCASTDPYSFSYHEVEDQSRVLKEPSGDATLVVRREPGLILGPVTHFATLDGEKIVELEQGEQHAFHIQPGQYVVGSLCNTLFMPAFNETSLNAQPGKTYFYRIFSVGEQRCSIAPMTH